MRTVKEIIQDVERGESAVPLPITALRLLDNPNIHIALIEQILAESVHTYRTVEQIKELVKPYLRQPRQRLSESHNVKAGLCVIEGCNRKHYKWGWCKQHGEQLSTNGFISPIWVNNHRKLAENALGKPLPKGVQVHHLDVNPKHNHPANLVICPDAAYHMLIERRGRAYKASGHADWLKCIYCKKYDDPKKLRVPRSKKNRNVKRDTWAYHPRCAEENRAKYRK